MSFAYADRLEPRTGAVFSPATNVDRAALRGLEFLRRPDRGDHAAPAWELGELVTQLRVLVE